MRKNKIRVYSPMQVFVSYLITAIVLIVSLAPFVWVLISSFKADPMALPGFMLPDYIELKGYKTVLFDMNIGQYFLNSFKISTISVIINTAIITMAAYIFACIDFKGRGALLMLLVSTMFIPGTAMTYPIFKIVRDLGLYNTQAGVIMIYSCGTAVVSLFVIKNYFATIPHDIEESAQIDGCSYFGTFVKIMLPIAMPGILTAMVLNFLGNWNEYYWASLLLVDRTKLTIPVLLSNFTTQFETNYNGLFSAIVIIIIPPIVLFSCCSKFFVKALSGGAVKG